MTNDNPINPIDNPVEIPKLKQRIEKAGSHFKIYDNPFNLGFLLQNIQLKLEIHKTEIGLKKQVSIAFQRLTVYKMNQP